MSLGPATVRLVNSSNIRATVNAGGRRIQSTATVDTGGEQIQSTATVNTGGRRIQSTVTVNTGDGQIQSTAPVTLVTAAAVNRLDTLVDVEEISPADGATLVYRSSDDKYVVQQLSLENVSGALDGGSF